MVVVLTKYENICDEIITSAGASSLSTHFANFGKRAFQG